MRGAGGVLLCYWGLQELLQAHFLSAIIFKYCRALWAASLCALPQEIPEPWQTVMGLVESSARHWYCPLALSSSAMTRSNMTVNVKCTESPSFMKTSLYYSLNLYHSASSSALSFFSKQETKMRQLNPSSSQTQLGSVITWGSFKGEQVLWPHSSLLSQKHRVGGGGARVLHFLFKAPKAILMWLAEQCLQTELNHIQLFFRGEKPTG